MNEDIENRPDMNSGEKWFEMDLLDLANCIRLNDPVEEIAASCAGRDAKSATKSPSWSDPVNFPV